MNSDLASGYVLIDENSELLDEWRLLQWDDDRRKEDPRFENHLSDACLYAWRESKHYTFATELVAPKVGSPEYYAMLEEQMLESKEQELAIKDTQSWWDEGWMLN